MTNPTPYITPDEADAFVEKLSLSPEEEAWTLMAIMDYRIVCRTLVGLARNQLVEKSDVE